MNSGELSLQDYVDILVRRWRILAIILGLALAAALVATLRTDTVYRAEAEVLIRTGSTNQLFPSANETGNRLVRNSQAEITYLRTDAYRAAAAGQLGRSANVSIDLVTDSDVNDTGRIEFVASDPLPDLAAEAAQAYAQAYIDSRNAADLADIERQLDDVAEDQAIIRPELDALERPVNDIDTLIAATTDPIELATLTTQRNQLIVQFGSDIARLESDLAQADNRFDQLSEARDALADPTMTAVISQAASVPSSPSSTSWVQNVLVALAVGLVAGVGVALLREALDSRVDSDREMTGLVDGVVLGHVGSVRGLKRDTDLIVAQKAPDTSALEAFRKIRSAVMFAQAGQTSELIQVTSPLQGNGKTMVASNLAVAFVQQGLSVLIIDADLRRPRVHKEFRMSGHDHGLTAILAEGARAEDVVRLDLATGAHVLPAGQIPPNPSELLGTDALTRLYKLVREEFDLVIVDSPPLLPVPDAQIIAPQADGVILVVDAAATTKREISDAAALLTRANATLIGTVINRVKRGSRGYRHAYGYEYH